MRSSNSIFLETLKNPKDFWCPEKLRFSRKLSKARSMRSFHSLSFSRKLFKKVYFEKTMIKIRKANKKDFEAFWKLQKEFMDDNNKDEIVEGFKYSMIKSKIRKNFLKILKDKNSLLIFLQDDGGVMGFLEGYISNMKKTGYFYKEKWGYLQDIFISAKYRGKGYARLLINEFLKFLKKRKIKICTLHTDSYNKSAIKLYNKIGFKGPIQYKFYRYL